MLRHGVPEAVRALAAERLLGFSEPSDRSWAPRQSWGRGSHSTCWRTWLAFRLDAFGQHLVEAERNGMLTLTEPAAGRFVHALLRDGVYGRCRPPSGRRGTPAQPTTPTRAGHRAASVLAYEDAVRWYETALAHLEQVDAEVGQRAQVLVALADARLGCGDRAGARSDFLEAATLAREASLFDTLARAALGLGSGAAGFEVGLLDRDQLDLLEEARQHLAEHARPARHGDGSTFGGDDVSESAAERLALAEQSLSLARQADDDAAQAYALAALCDALAGPDFCQAREKYAAEIIMRAVRARNPALELLGRRLRLLAALESGDRAAAEAEMLAFRARAEAFRHPLYGWYVLLWRGMWALAEGRLDECAVQNELADVEGRAAHSENAFLLVLTQRWCLCGELNDVARLRELFVAVDFDRQGGVWARISSALVCAQLGETADARRRLDAVAAQLDALPRDSEWLPSMAQIAETVGIIGPHPWRVPPTPLCGRTRSCSRLKGLARPFAVR